MSTAEMDPHFERQLKAALDRITPPASTPRYASMRPGDVRPWRFAPVLLAGATAILLVLAATATTGSPNPAVWTGDAASAIGSVGHPTETSQPPRPVQPAPAPHALAPVPTHDSDHHASPKPEPSERPEASPTPEASQSPAPSDDHSGSGSGDRSGSSSPTPSPSPSPEPDDH